VGLHPSKTIANVILPCSTRDDGKDIGSFLRIMSKNDNRIKKSFDNKKLGGYIQIEKVKNCSNDIKKEEKDIEFKYEMIYDKLGVLTNGCEIWEKRLIEIKVYIDKYKKRPSSTNKNKHIRKLGVWVLTQIDNYKKKQFIMTNKCVYDRWTIFTMQEKYKKYFISNDDEWKNNLINVKKYMDENNKRPSSKNIDISIKKMGGWISNQIKNYTNKQKIMSNKIIYNVWTEFTMQGKYKKYFISNNNEWKNKLIELKKYIDKNNKKPQFRDKNIDIDVRKIGSWSCDQQHNYINKQYIMSNETIYDTWTEFITHEKYKKYFTSNVDEWKNKLTEVKKYIDANNKKPSSANKNIIIKQLGEWIHNQQYNYAKKLNIMLNEVVYDMWTKFITQSKNKKYFKQ
jgi:hypothetical protein